MNTANENETRELDAWIAEHVMGWTWEDYDDNNGKYLLSTDGFNYGVQHWNNHPPTYMNFLPRYTSNPGAAMGVLEKCIAKSMPCFQDSGGGNIRIFAHDGLDGEEFSVEAKTLPLAICLFAKELFTQ